ncbi:MAG: hypothetical protein ACE5K7_00435 [Phycisphaerae bacterium]
MLPAWRLAGVVVAAWAVAAAAGQRLDSDRYLGIDQLHPGMKGLGKSVFSGTDIATFEVEVVSVLRNVEPQRHVILVRCSGAGLEQTGMIAGMSGSPVYIRDPLDGRLKLIGAIAFAWLFQKQPLAGVQPISQMLEVGQAGPTRSSSAAWRAPADPKDRFVQVGLLPIEQAGDDRQSRPPGGLRPLDTPLVVGGASPAAMDWLARRLAEANLVPIGGVGAGRRGDYPMVRLEPGAVLCVPLLQGDMEITALGAVTEVVGEKVLGFGHAFFGEGQLELPMATGYVPAVVPLMTRSFKLASTLQVVGTLTSDEYTGVVGRLGRQAKTVPLTVTVRQGGWSRTYRYRTVQHESLTWLMSGTAMVNSATARHDLPREHTVRYKHRVVFSGLGEYAAENVASQVGLRHVLTDLISPLRIMLNNPFGRARIERIDCQIDIEPAAHSAIIEQVELLKDRLRPGQDLEVIVTWRQFRGPRQRAHYKLRIPEALPDGQYPLMVAGWSEHLSALRRERPDLFEPRSLKSLLAITRRVAAVREDALFLRLSTKRAGLSVGGRELPRLPSYQAAIIADDKRSDVQRFREVIVVAHRVPFVVSGKRTFTIEVDRHAEP